MVFLVEGKEIHANRAILGVRCQHFKTLLFDGFRESESKQKHVKYLALQVDKNIGSHSYGLPRYDEIYLHRFNGYNFESPKVLMLKFIKKINKFDDVG